jgi:hypothetical protein
MNTVINALSVIQKMKIIYIPCILKRYFHLLEVFWKSIVIVVEIVILNGKVNRINRIIERGAIIENNKIDKTSK